MPPALWVLIVLGIAGICFFFAKFTESFPAASIDLRYSRAQIEQISSGFSRAFGYDPNGAVTASMFSYDDDAKNFLEYELGQEKANALMKSEIPIWYWMTRFCRPLQLEEMQVAVSPQGTLTSFSHSLPSDMPMPTVSHADAQALAKTFVEQVSKRSLSGWKLIKDSEKRQVKRTDHNFTWEDQTRDFKEGRLRAYVYISGNQVTAYSSFLHVPEKFQRRFAEIRSYNYLLKQISSIIYTILSSAISFIFIWAFASGRVRWKFALAAGIAGAVVAILNWINAFPSVVFSYETTMKFEQYVQSSFVDLGIQALFTILACVVFTGALEPIYRLAFPEKIALEKVFTLRGLRSSGLFQAIFAGLAVFGMHTAYVVAFYLFGNHLGFWSPLELRETSTLSGLWPVYSAVDVGLSAGTTEELMYRVLCMAMFRQLTKNFWIANFLQAASWAFMHSDYPQEPAYARGVELTIGGFFYGWVLRRFGLPACILAHYTYDAFLGVTPLITSENPADKMKALLAVAPGVVALIVSGLLILTKGRVENPEQLSNAAVTAQRKAEPVKEAEPAVSYRYHGLPNRLRWGLGVAGIIAALLTVYLPLHRIGQNNVVRIDREQAIAAARDYLKRSGVSTVGRQTVAYLTDDTDDMEMQYVLEHATWQRTNELANILEPRLMWTVRFFRPQDPQEFYVVLAPDGRPISQHIQQEEDAPGDKLDEATARRLVENFLATDHPELKGLVFEDSTKHQHPNRNDYDFSFKIPALKVGDADFRVTSGTVGGYVSTFARGWQIPESWTFERNKVYPKDQWLSYLRQGFWALIGVAAVWWLFDVLRSGKLVWKPAIVLALFSAAAVLIKQINGLPVFFSSYDTQVPISTFVTKQGISVLIAMLSGAASFGMLAAFAVTSYRMMFPLLPVSSLWRAAFPGRGVAPVQTRQLWLDATVVAISATLIHTGLNRLVDWAYYQFSPSVHSVPISITSNANYWSPAFDALISGLSAGLGVAMVCMIATAAGFKFFRGSRWKMMLFLLVGTLIAHSGLRYWQDYTGEVIGFLVTAWIICLFIADWARLNVLAYVFVGLLGGLLDLIYVILRQGGEVYYRDLSVLVLFALAPIVYCGWLYFGPQHTTDFE